MASVVKIKRSSVSGKRPTTSNIETGELALNLADGRLFSSNGTSVFEVGANVHSLHVGTGGASFGNGAFSIPSSDGSAGQVLTTDGSGNVTWQAVAAGSLTIQQANSSAPTETYTNITTLQFDEDSGFDVTSPSSGVAKVAMNSTFKYWEVDGVQQLTAVGLDTVNFIAGDGITITANGSASPQSLTISSTAAAPSNSTGFPFFKSDGSQDNIHSDGGAFPFFLSNGTQDNIAISF
jgi:hypothetical protein